MDFIIFLFVVDLVVTRPTNSAFRSFCLQIITAETMFETNFRLLDQEIYGCFEILLQFRFFRSIICFGFFCFFFNTSSIFTLCQRYEDKIRGTFQELLVSILFPSKENFID